ncbi:YidC/Oxa1 family membrane protein insertase [Paenibacillus dendritiformis]|uniref:YidC/Oxa1 family membrane protein insertase n=1 Tax=Paenibacillus dendritiformis TaxID=130049 RepID=UPI00105A6670|nr:membrane protein insertase YidC [Paenibacillus dendritiformis]TDL51638.1 membrane protein insertase YidC [Paenibacillus dendritiformis]
MALLQGIADILYMVMRGLYGLIGDWGIAVILLTLAVRGLLFAVSLHTSRQQLRQARMQKELQAVRAQCGEDSDRLLQETGKLYAKYGIRPISQLASLLVQMPILYALYQLFSAHGSAMSSLLVPWVASFAQSDPWHIVPIAYAAVSFVSMLIPLTAELAGTGSGLSRSLLPLLATGLSLLFLWRMPVALGLYWTANKLYFILERLFFRTGWGRRLLYKNMPEAS